MKDRKPVLFFLFLVVTATFVTTDSLKSQEKAQPLDVFRTLRGHTGAVWSVAFSPDSKTLVSGSYDNSIRLWNVATGELLRKFSVPLSAVMSVAFSPDGQTLASSSTTGSSDDRVILWDVATGEQLWRRMEPAWGVAFRPDGQILASGSHDNSVRLWRVTGEALRPLIGHTGSVMSVAFSPDGQTLASGSVDNSVRLWNLYTGHQVHLLNGHSDNVHSVAFAPDGRTLASGSADKSVRLWNVATGKAVRQFPHVNMVWCVAFSPDGQALASGTLKDGTVHLWDVRRGEKVRELNGHSGRLHSVAFSPDGTLLASSSGDDTVILWDVFVPKRGLPPNLFAELSFEDDNGDGILEALEAATLKINISNRGRGRAQRLRFEVVEDSKRNTLKIDSAQIPYLDPNSTKVVSLRLQAKQNVGTGERKLRINVLEHFGYDMDPAFLVLNTRAYEPPRLVFSGLEILDSDPDAAPIVQDGLLQAGELVKTKIVIQNVGLGTARSVSFSVKSSDPNVYLESNSDYLGYIASGDVKEFQVVISPNKRVSASGNLGITLTLRELVGKGELRDFPLPIQLNQKPPEPNILRVEAKTEKLKPQMARFEYTSQKFTARVSNLVDIKDVQPAKTRRKNSVAVIFGAEDYKYLPPAPYAANDARLMKRYFEKRLGVEQVVIYSGDEVSGFVFDDVFNPDNGELQKTIIRGETELFVYYSGHGIPNKYGNETYLFPVDGKVARLERQGYSLTRLFENLNKLGASHVTVVLDACFTGASRFSEQIQQRNLVAAKGLLIKIEKPWLSYPNFTVINSSTEAETSLGFDKSETGLFTYYFAAALQGEADANGDRRVTLGELQSYVTKNVIETSKKLSGVQTPQFYGDKNRVLVEW